ncbi:MAG: SIMPL domain-containing protein [Sphingomonadaceae bacterium]|nr:SIMPL domain-containing protein [Sphingomonadaceae bacterium]
MRAFVLPLLLCAALAACDKPPPDARGLQRDEVLLQVSATGHVETRPDEARFTAGVSTVAPTAAAAGTGSNEAINRVVAALRALGIRAEDIQTRSITLNRVESGPNRGRFEASNQIEVRVRDLNKAGQAIGAATEAGANILGGPDFDVADPEAASNGAYAAAYRAARARAEAYSVAAGLRIDRILAIRDVTGQVGPMVGQGFDADMAANQAPAVAPPPVMPGRNSSEVRIRVDFALVAQ